MPVAPSSPPSFAPDATPEAMRPSFASTALAFVAALALAACGGESASTPNELFLEGNSLAAKGDHAAALENFQEAIAALGDDTSSPLFAKLQVAKVTSHAHEDADTAVQEFLTVSAEHPDHLGKPEMAAAVTKLSEGGAFTAAFQIVKEAEKRYPGDSDIVALMERVDQDIQNNASDDDLKALEGLGYVSK
jgi:tetratricopeptide (TPR) repeat protein